ncbi:class D sortase [Bacillus sp. 165]|uniref:class D sortase n=1 Tax=Bacillus sp. 165 TaxID=1529117 RepID=UPI001ADC2F10|nr:class D sortase [Bacillus sp. 165]MBO9129771.1 class D sortase [Bacillus sp. 165]
MRKLLATLLCITGIILVSISGWQIWDTKQKQFQSKEIAEEILTVSKEKKMSRTEFMPKQNGTLGILRIPKIDANLPIIEGTDPEDLKKGVGHYTSTAFPGDQDQILLSGHRDTVFQRFGELKPGDRFIVELPYGTFEYEMKNSRIVKADDTTVIQSTKPDEVLTLSTCYPFRYVGSAPERYIIYAYPVSSVVKQS